MQIDKYHNPKVKYSSIPVSETFEFEETLYIKLDPMDGLSVNAVALKTGRVHFFGGNVQVFKIDVKVVPV